MWRIFTVLSGYLRFFDEFSGCKFQNHSPQRTKPAIWPCRAGGFLNQERLPIYARVRAFVKRKSSSFADHPDFVPIEWSGQACKQRAEPALRCHGGTSRNAAGALQRRRPGFRPLESWHELRDNPDGLVSARQAPPSLEAVPVGALRENSDTKDTSGLYAAEKCLSARVLPEMSGRGELRGRRNCV